MALDRAAQAVSSTPPTYSARLMARRNPGLWTLSTGILLVLLAFALRVYRLDALSLRGDESFTVLFVAYPLPELWEGIRTIEPNPPLYYFLLRGAMALWGQSEFAVRYVSALFGVLAVPLAYQLGRALLTGAAAGAPTKDSPSMSLGAQVGLLAAALTAIAPYQVWHSQDVRNYTVWPALSALALLLLLRALRRDRPALWAAYIAAALAALYTHYYEVLIVLAANAYVFLAHRRDRALLKRWIVIQAILGALYLPWPLFFSSRPLTYVIDPTETPGPLGVVWQSVRAFVVGDTMPDPAAAAFTGAALALLVAGLAWAWRQASCTRTRHAGAFLLLWLAVPSLCMYLLTLWRPLFRERYLNAIAPACYLALALSLMALARLRWGKVLAASAGLALLAAPMLFSLSQYYWNPRYAKSPDWRGLAAYLHDQAQAADVIVQTYPDPTLAYYYRGPALRTVLPDRPAVDQAGDMPVDRLATAATLQQLMAERRRLWLLPVRSQWDPETFVEGWLDRRAHVVYEGQVAGFALKAYERAEAPAPAIPFSQGATLGADVRLLGFDVQPGPSCGASQGASLRITDPTSCSLRVTLYWQALADTADAPSVSDAPYTIFVHLVDEAGQLCAQHDGQPQGGGFPTTEWLPGDVIPDAHDLALSPEISPGLCHLQAGLYHLASGERLPAYDDRGWRWADDAVRLDLPIEVAP